MSNKHANTQSNNVCPIAINKWFVWEIWLIQQTPRILMTERAPNAEATEEKAEKSINQMKQKNQNEWTKHVKKKCSENRNVIRIN